MNNATWEMSMLQWDKQGADGKVVTALDVADLIFSQSQEQRRKAFRVLSEAVGREGIIYPCSLSVIMTILPALPYCTAENRIECLDLVAQIAVSESAAGAEGVAEKCLAEIRNAFWYFAYGLQFDVENSVVLYVDILGCLGSRFEDLRPLIEKYLELALTRSSSKLGPEIIRNTLAELQGKKSS